MNTGTTKPSIASLTGLRFIAAFLVLLPHTVNNLGFHGPASNDVAMLGVSLFFVLSGFVIHYNYEKIFRSESFFKALKIFLSARFARIYPLFLFFALINLAFSQHPAGYWAAFGPYFLYYLTLTHSWVYSLHGAENFLGFFYSISWTISTEFFFYLAYPLIFFALVRLDHFKKTFFTAIAIAFVVFLISLAASVYWRPPSSLPNDADAFLNWFAYQAPYFRIWEFILGCLTAHLFSQIEARCSEQTRSEHFWGTVLLLAAFIYLFGVIAFLLRGALAPSLFFFKQNFIFAPALSVVIFCCARYRNIISRIVSSRPLVHGGDLSYSIYLSQPTILALFQLPHPPFSIGEAAIRMFFVIFFIIVLSYGTYHLVEVPAKKWLRARLTEGPLPGR